MRPHKSIPPQQQRQSLQQPCIKDQHPHDNNNLTNKRDDKHNHGNFKHSHKPPQAKENDKKRNSKENHPHNITTPETSLLTQEKHDSMTGRIRDTPTTRNEAEDQ